MSRFRKNITIFAFLLSVCVMPLMASSGKTVLMGYYSEPGLMNGAELGKIKSGYAYEYIQELSSYAGWKYQYVYGSFKELYQKLIVGEIDMLPYVTFTEARAKEILFPEMPMGWEQFFIASMKPGRLSDSLAELQGKKVGTNKGAFHLGPFNELLKSKGITCDIVISTSPEARWRALEHGDIDFSIETSTVFQSVDLHAVYEFGDKYPYYLVVSPERRDLQEELNLAQKELDEVNPSFLENNKIKYFKGIPLFRQMPEEGRIWLYGHKSIKIGTYDNDAPYVIDNHKGDISGIAPDYVKIMFDAMKINIPVEWKIYDGKQSAIKALENGDIDLINPYYHNYSDAERDGLVISSAVYYAGFSVLFNGDYTNETLSVIATPFTRLGTSYVRDNYPNATIIPCTNGFDCIEKLMAGEATSVVMHTDALIEIASSFKKDFNIKALNASCAVCFASIPENAPLVSIINKSIPFVTDIEMNAIQNKYAAQESTQVTVGQFINQHPGYVFIGSLFFLGSIVIAFVLKIKSDMNYTKQLFEAKHKAEAASEAKTEFLFSMSHDIRTPMNAILGFTDMAVRYIDKKEKVLDSLSKIQDASELLLSLINNILDISSIESGVVVLEEKAIDIFHSFANIETTMQELARNKNIKLTFEIGKVKNRYAYADLARCQRVFVNIITNAIKYTNDGGFVKVKCEQTGTKDKCGLYLFTFEDNGIGISDNFQKRVFEEFSREKSTTASGVHGTGLGLTVCKNFVTAMKGTIDFKSQHGKGTTFYVTLPFRLRDGKEDASTLKEYKSSHEDERDALADFKGRRVLLVEDNEMNCEIATNILENEGMEVFTAYNGEAAVKIMKEKGPVFFDFILMDIQMPIMNGYEATEEIRKMYPNDSIPIIALSANAFAEDKAASIASGMNEHLAKPVNAKLLRKVLAKYIK